MITKRLQEAMDDTTEKSKEYHKLDKILDIQLQFAENQEYDNCPICHHDHYDSEPGKDREKFKQAIEAYIAEQTRLARIDEKSKITFVFDEIQRMHPDKEWLLKPLLEPLNQSIKNSIDHLSKKGTE